MVLLWVLGASAGVLGVSLGAPGDRQVCLASPMTPVTSRKTAAVPSRLDLLSVLWVERSAGLVRAPSASAGWFGGPVARAPGSETTAKPLNTSLDMGETMIYA